MLRLMMRQTFTSIITGIITLLIVGLIMSILYLIFSCLFGLYTIIFALIITAVLSIIFSVFSSLASIFNFGKSKHFKTHKVNYKKSFIYTLPVLVLALLSILLFVIFGGLQVLMKVRYEYDYFPFIMCCMLFASIFFCFANYITLLINYTSKKQPDIRCPKCNNLFSRELINKEFKGTDTKEETKNKTSTGSSKVGEVFSGSDKVGDVYHSYTSNMDYYRTVTTERYLETYKCVHCGDIRAREKCKTKKSNWSTQH